MFEQKERAGFLVFAGLNVARQNRNFKKDVGLLLSISEHKIRRRVYMGTSGFSKEHQSEAHLL